MKTAEELAQHIADDFVLEQDKRVALLVAIREALTDYAEERVKVKVREGWNLAIRGEIRKVARNEALESAAEVAEELPTSEHGRDVCRQIAQKIRALKSKP